MTAIARQNARQNVRHRNLVAAASLFASLLAGVGCGVPVDDEPRAISRTTLDPTVEESRATPTTSDRPGAQEVTAFFLNDDHVSGVTFSVEDEATLESALAFAVGEPPANHTTAVPPGTRILSAEVETTVAVIDLTAEINDISGQSQKFAYAQLAFTAFEFDAVDQVRFLVDGKGVDAPTDNGNKTMVSVGDYATLKP